jgi:Cyclopropane fatty acid synthase and related methyltransferases
MFEAVGEAYWPGFFRTVAQHLKPGARACIQTITIADDLFDDYRRGTDFIQRYIFPGGMLPSRSAFIAQAEAAGLEVVKSWPSAPTTPAPWRYGANASPPNSKR